MTESEVRVISENPFLFRVIRNRSEVRAIRDRFGSVIGLDP